MKMFDDLVFHTDHLDITRARMDFGEYTLSVIRESGKKLYEFAVFHGGEFVQLPGITDEDDVTPYQSEDDISTAMKKLYFMTGGE